MFRRLNLQTIVIFAALAALLIPTVAALAQDDSSDDPALTCPFGFTRQGGQQNGFGAQNQQQNQQGMGPGGQHGRGNQGRMEQRGQMRQGWVIGEHPCLVVPASVELPDEVIAVLVDALNEEQLAYASYQAVMDQFGAQVPFRSIAWSEARHIEALERIFTRYNLPLPAAVAVEIPAFTDLDAAFDAAIAVEQEDIALYDDILETVADYPDMVRVFTHLQNASRQHLRSLERWAASA